MATFVITTPDASLASPLRLLAPSAALVGLILAVGPPIAAAQQLGAAPPGPAIAVSPARIELEIGDQQTTEAIRVMNLTERTVEARVTLATWDLDERNQVREVEPTPQTLDQWMVVNPVHFTIDPGGSQVVRFAVRPRVEPAPGEHRAMVYFQEIQQADETPTSSQVRFLFRLGVAVYGFVGPVERTAVLHGVRLDRETDPTQVTFDIEATGTAHVRLTGSVTVAAEGSGGSADGQTAELTEPLPTTPVLPGYRRVVTTRVPHPKAPGRYSLRIVGTLGDSTSVDWTGSFAVTQSQPTPPPSSPTPPRPDASGDTDARPTTTPAGEATGG